MINSLRNASCVEYGYGTLGARILFPLFVHVLTSCRSHVFQLTNQDVAETIFPHLRKYFYNSSLHIAATRLASRISANYCETRCPQRHPLANESETIWRDSASRLEFELPKCWRIPGLRWLSLNRRRKTKSVESDRFCFITDDGIPSRNKAKRGYVESKDIYR